VSLTISNLTENQISVSLIPHTLESTSLGKLKVGDFVNIETDILHRYLQNMAKNQ
jgi:riboflavin synthase